MSKSIEEKILDSFKYGGNSNYLEDLYQKYLLDPNEIDSDWKNYFDSIHTNVEERNHQAIQDRFKNIQLSRKSSNEEKTVLESPKSSEVQNLINAFRRRGHQVAKIDPLHLRKEKNISDLDLSFHNLSEVDLETSFALSNFQDVKTMTLSEIKTSIEQTYTSNIGYTFMHIVDSKIRRWFLDKIEGKANPYAFTSDEKKQILKRVVDSEGLEKFLASKYPGAKRFGLEGGESLIPLLDTLIEDFGSKGVKEVCLGMSHRGRLNVLINVMGKKPSELFSEFAEELEAHDARTGDVKYHLGFSSNVLTSGGEVHLSLGSNPSHLEIVNPVILGSVKARQDRRQDEKNFFLLLILSSVLSSFY